ncbi:hypothetical protein ACK83U_12505 [Rhizobium sp. WW22]|uniref:hypothetical protein n=1 Tax=Rhizobium sp. WW22 TaxID=3389070 RepID=UPI00399A7E8B
MFDKLSSFVSKLHFKAGPKASGGSKAGSSRFVVINIHIDYERNALVDVPIATASTATSTVTNTIKCIKAFWPELCRLGQSMLRP